MNIEMMLDSMRLMDEIDLYLKPLGITIEDYLETRGKTLEDVKHNELEIICATLKENVFSNEEEFEKFPEETIQPIR